MTFNPPRPLRIGIVSNPVYCKPFVSKLLDEGFDVQLLGEDPTTIPPSIDIVVLRIAASSHGASHTTMKWAREGGRVIHENGLSGVRRTLKTMLLEDKSFLYFKRALDVLTASEGKALTEEEIRSTLEEMACPKFFLEMLLDPNKSDSEEDSPIREYPWSEPWTRAYPEIRVRRDYEEALQLTRTLPEFVKNGFRDLYQGLPKTRDVTDTFQKEFGGKPGRFMSFMFLLLPADTAHLRRDLANLYTALSEKKTDARIVEGAAWITGRTVVLEEKKVKVPEPVVPEPTEEEPVEVPLEVESVLSENEEGALTFLEEMQGKFEYLKKEMEDQVLELMTENANLVKGQETLRREVLDLKEHTRKTLQTMDVDLRADTRKTLQAMEGLKFDEEILGKKFAFKDEIAEVNSRWETFVGRLHQEVAALREEIETLRLNSPPPVVVAPASGSDLMATLNALRESGFSISISYTPEKK